MNKENYENGMCLSEIFGMLGGLFVLIAAIFIIWRALTTDYYSSQTCYDFKGMEIYHYYGKNAPHIEQLDNNMIRLPDNKVYQASCNYDSYWK